jgi:uncharacterized OB-fold protein
MNQSKNITSINPPRYVRANKEWSGWIGKVGIVKAVTTIRVASDAHGVFTPYQYAVISFDTDTNFCKSFVVADGNNKVVLGDAVECVLRRLSKPNDFGIIEYGIKVVRL